MLCTCCHCRTGREKKTSKLLSDKEILGKFNFENCSENVDKSCSTYLINKYLQNFINIADMYVHRFKKSQEHERVCDVFLSWVDEHQQQEITVNTEKARFEGHYKCTHQLQEIETKQPETKKNNIREVSKENIMQSKITTYQYGRMNMFI